MFSLFVSRSENTRKSSLEILRPTRSSQMAIEFGLLVVCMDAPCQEKPVDADHRVKGTSLDMFGQKKTSNYLKFQQHGRNISNSDGKPCIRPEMPLAKRKTDVFGFHIGSVHLRHEMLRRSAGRWQLGNKMRRRLAGGLLHVTAINHHP